MTKEEMQKELDRMYIILGIAFMLIPPHKTKIFFDRVAEIGKSKVM